MIIFYGAVSFTKEIDILNVLIYRTFIIENIYLLQTCKANKASFDCTKCVSYQQPPKKSNTYKCIE